MAAVPDGAPLRALLGEPTGRTRRAGLSPAPPAGARSLLYAGIAVIADSLWVLALLAPALFVMHYGVIAREELYLERKFGSQYVEYKARVRRWL